MVIKAGSTGTRLNLWTFLSSQKKMFSGFRKPFWRHKSCKLYWRKKISKRPVNMYRPRPFLPQSFPYKVWYLEKKRLQITFSVFSSFRFFIFAINQPKIISTLWATISKNKSTFEIFYKGYKATVQLQDAYSTNLPKYVVYVKLP